MEPPEPGPAALCDLALAGAAAERGDLAAAERHLAAASAASGHSAYRHVRVLLVAGRGDAAAALTAVRALVREEPQPGLLLWQARLETRLGQGEEARRSLDRILEAPGRVDAAGNLLQCGELYASLGLDHEAERSVRLALDRQAGITRAATAIRLLLRAGRWKAAVRQVPLLARAGWRRLAG